MAVQSHQIVGYFGVTSSTSCARLPQAVPWHNQMFTKRFNQIIIFENIHLFVLSLFFGVLAKTTSEKIPGFGKCIDPSRDQGLEKCDAKKPSDWNWKYDVCIWAAGTTDEGFGDVWSNVFRAVQAKCIIMLLIGI